MPIAVQSIHSWDVTGLGTRLYVYRRGNQHQILIIISILKWEFLVPCHCPEKKVMPIVGGGRGKCILMHRLHGLHEWVKSNHAMSLIDPFLCNFLLLSFMIVVSRVVLEWFPRTNLME